MCFVLQTSYMYTQRLRKFLQNYQNLKSFLKVEILSPYKLKFCLLLMHGRDILQYLVFNSHAYQMFISIKTRNPQVFVAAEIWLWSFPAFMMYEHCELSVLCCMYPNILACVFCACKLCHISLQYPIVVREQLHCYIVFISMKLIKIFKELIIWFAVWYLLPFCMDFTIEVCACQQTTI